MGANPCLLITGALGLEDVTITSRRLYDSIGLSDNCIDTRRQYQKVFPVNFNSVQNIRKWQINQHFQMEDTSDYTAKSNAIIWRSTICVIIGVWTIILMLLM
jgi:hypothetical protein